MAVYTLRMAFETDSGKNVLISLPYCKEDLSSPEVRSAMQVLIDKPVLAYKLVKAIGAEIVQRSARELF